MKTRLNPYLGFRGDAREAIEFYATVFGGTPTISTFDDFHASDDPEEKDLIMHSELVTDAGFSLMASDTPESMPFTPGSNFSVSLSGDDDDELRGYWQKLVVGGTVSLPLERAPWGDTFGMCVDQFGVSWMVNVVQAQSD